MKQRLFFILLTCFSIHLSGQKDFSHLADSTFQPFDNTAVLKYNINMEVGFFPNQKNNFPALKQWSSYVYSLHFYRQFKAYDGHLIIKTGGGFGFWKNNFEQPLVVNPLPNEFSFDTLTGYNQFRKSKLALNYLELPLEVLVKTNWNIPIKFSIGAKLGCNFSSVNKIKYIDTEDHTITTKYKQRFGTSRFVGQVYSRFVISHIGVYSSLNLTSLFQSGTYLADYKPWTLGITYLID